MAQQVVSVMKEWQIWFFALWSFFVTLALAVFTIFVVMKHGELKDIKKRLAAQDGQLKIVVEEKSSLLEAKNSLLVEIEKVKERFKYEHQNAENMQKEIEESKRHVEELFRAEFELKAKQLEQSIRAEMMAKYLVPEGQKENFVQHQKERFMKYVSEPFGIGRSRDGSGSCFNQGKDSINGTEPL